MNVENDPLDVPVLEDLVEEYSLSPQEAERVLKQFGSDREELDLLLGHKGAADVPSPNSDEVKVGDFLFEI